MQVMRVRPSRSDSYEPSVHDSGSACGLLDLRPTKRSPSVCSSDVSSASSVSWLLRNITYGDVLNFAVQVFATYYIGSPRLKAASFVVEKFETDRACLAAN